MSAPRDGHAGDGLRPRMTDAELERVFDLPAGYMATASAAEAQRLEQLRSWAEDRAEESAREFLYGRAPSVSLADFARAVSPEPLHRYQVEFLAVVAAAGRAPVMPRRPGKSALASAIRRLSGQGGE